MDQDHSGPADLTLSVPARTVPIVKVAGYVETIPEKDGGPAEREVKDLVVDVDDVDQAQTALKDLAGPGWRLLSVRRI